MNVLFLNDLSTQVYEANKAQGFWDSERNHGETFMLIVSEMAEALEAHRVGNLTPPNLVEFNALVAASPNDFASLFKYYIKDSIFDELADCVIRVLDFCGGFNHILPPTFFKRDFSLLFNFGEELFRANHILFRAFSSISQPSDTLTGYVLSEYIKYIYDISQYFGVDLTPHILLKLQYNKTRSKRHGKNY